MVSIIPRRKITLSVPFTTDKVGMQLHCTPRIEPLLSLTVTAMPLLFCTVRVADRSELQEGLVIDGVTAGQLLSAAVNVSPEIQCITGILPALNLTTKAGSLLNCTVSAQPLLRATVTRCSQIDGTIRAIPLLGLKVATSPAMSATVSRPQLVN